MIDADERYDSYNSWLEALAAMRLRLVVAGDVLPRFDEPLDLMTLRAVGGAGEQPGW